MKNPKILVRSVLFQLTQKCALRCKHCFMSAGTTGQSLTLGKAEKIISHLPSNLQSIMLTGGDPFMEKELLLGAANAVMKRRFPSLGKLEVQTTGYWASSRKKAKEELKKLIDAGVNGFSIYGNDAWHINGGLNVKNHDNIVAVLKDYGFEQEDKSSREAALVQIYDYTRKYYVLRGTGNKVRATGRASSLKNKDAILVDVNPVCRSGRDFLTMHKYGYYYIVDYKGNVSSCIWGNIPPLGNLIDDSLSNILKKAKSDKLCRLLDKGNIPDMAVQMGWSKEAAQKELETNGRCSLHQKLIKQSD